MQYLQIIDKSIYYGEIYFADKKDGLISKELKQHKVYFLVL